MRTRSSMIDAVIDTITAVTEPTHDIRKATKIISENLVVTTACSGRPRKNEKTVTLVVTFGKPNYELRTFIALCKKHGEPFPVKKLRLKWYK